MHLLIPSYAKASNFELTSSKSWTEHEPDDSKEEASMKIENTVKIYISDTFISMNS